MIVEELMLWAFLGLVAGAGSPCPGAHHRQRRPLAGSMSEGTVATRQPGLLMHGSRRVERRRPVPVEEWLTIGGATVGRAAPAGGSISTACMTKSTR
jgi:hypothetical protein